MKSALSDNEQDRQKRAAEAEPGRFQQVCRTRPRDAFERIQFRLDAQALCNAGADEGGKDAGDERHIVEHSDAYHFNAEDGRGNGRSEKCGENRAHPAHHGDAAVVIGKMQEFTEAAAHPAAELQGSTFTADGCPAEVGEDGRHENQRTGRCRDVVTFGDGGQDHIGAAVLFFVQGFVEQGDRRTDDGQKTEDPRMLCPKRGDGLDGFGKKAADKSAGGTCRGGKERPSDKIMDAVNDWIVFD